ncbi:ANTAR domain-containing protein [Modestobacter marinus]|uniref:ANTAR domain-containing protein n=1 Tax=Modestobacter marinus TaxID=477641 RepID=UPI001C979464|nr:ANTAR domain-containing protein [Modestobacter marinus]
MDPVADPARPDVAGDLLRTPEGLPAALVVRSHRGWTVLGPDGPVDTRTSGAALDGLSLVEAMTLADLVAEELGAHPEPGRQARRAARGPAAVAAPDDDPRAAELAELRRTISQLEHALAARVSIERAIGVLAERHCTTPRVAFEELRRRARSQGRPAHELAAEVLGTLPAAAPDEPPVPAPVPEAPRVVRPRPSRVPSADGAFPETHS